MADGYYAEHQKLRAVKRESQAIGEFIEWLHANNLMIADRDTSEEDPRGIERMLADHFEIDLQRIAEEKDAMVEEMRRVNGDGAAREGK